MLTTEQLLNLVGQPVKFANWHGVLQDVYVGLAEGEVLVKVLFAKNVFKRQGAEITPLSEQLEASTWEALAKQMGHYQAQQNGALDELIGVRAFLKSVV